MGGVIACGSPREVDIDARMIVNDVAIDVAIEDATLDAEIDAPPAVSLSPRCTTTPSVLIDVSPRRLLNFARSGDTLYVAAHDVGPSNEITDPIVFTIDLVSGTQSAAPFVPTAEVSVWPSVDPTGDVFGTGAGTVWQFHPGSAPVALVTGRDTPALATAEGGYVYWAEKQSAASFGALKRRLISGGTVENVGFCEDAWDIVIAGNEIFCGGFRGLYHLPKDGSGSIQSIAYNTGYPVASVMSDGAGIAFVSLYNYPDLWKATALSASATLIHRLTILGRYVGLTATSDYYYTVERDSGIRRIHRTTLDVERVYTSSANRDPVLWNNQLYFEAPNPLLSGDRYILHCVD